MAIRFPSLKQWLRYQYRKLVRPRTVTNGGLKLYLGEHSRSSYARSIYRDSHEAEEREIVLRHLEPGDTVLECGAGLGAVTVLCCQRIGSDRVHTFEANAALEPVLRRTFELNRVAPQLEMKMVSLTGGEQPFFVSDRFVVSSRYQSSGKGDSKATTLDSVSIQELIARIQPTFLIMDIEGAEVDLAGEELDLGSVKKLCIEMHPHLVGDEPISRVISNLLRQGFSLRLRECREDVLYFSRAA